MTRLAIFAVMASAAFGQATPAKQEFEVVSIKPSAPYTPGGQVNVALHIDGAQIRCTYFSLKEYIGMAYKVKYYQVTGPEWLSDRYDIAAKLPAGAKQDDVPEMLKTMLADRFHVTMHHETRDFPVYGLVVSKSGPKMKEAHVEADAPGAPGDGPKDAINVSGSGSAQGTKINLPKGASFTIADDHIEAAKLTMASFADLLARFVDRPVVDMTELKGSYDLAMTFTPEDFTVMRIRLALSAGVSLPPQALRLLDGTTAEPMFAAVETLGLKLENRKTPLDVLVVDHLEKAPTEN